MIPNITVCIPAFARSVKVLRYPITASLTFRLYDGINQLDEISVPSGSSPTIEIVGTETILNITNLPPADPVSFLALCYEIGI